MLSGIITTMLSAGFAAWMTLLGCSATDSPALQDAPPVAAPPQAATQTDTQKNEPEIEIPADPQAEHAALPEHLDQLLDRLEASAADLTGFAAKIIYETHSDFAGGGDLRTGELVYRVDAENDDRTFAVLFDSFIKLRDGRDGRRTKRLKHYIFDGRWLAEIDHGDKQFIKRELVAPGEKLDPLKLGEGPIPLPIGQRKADVLARFEVQEATLPEAGMLTRLDGEAVDAIRLVPYPESPEARDFASIDLFYDRATNLPVGILAIEPNGDSKTVLLSEPVRNPVLDDEMRRKLDITDPDPALWKVDIQPWRGAP